MAIKDLTPDEFEVRLDYLEYVSGPALDEVHAAWERSKLLAGMTDEDRKITGTKVVSVLDQIKHAAEECAKKMRTDGYEG